MTDRDNALTVQDSDLQRLKALAETFSGSGLLPRHIDTPRKVFAVMTMGQELGIGPWQAINGINVIQGKPTPSPALKLSLILASGKMSDFQCDPPATIKESKSCTVVMEREGKFRHSETFTIEDADAMGYGDKRNWKQQPHVMLKWRAIDACARVLFPDITAGFYSPDEIDSDLVVDEGGDVVYDDPVALYPDEGFEGFGDTTNRAPVEDVPEAEVIEDDADEAQAAEMAQYESLGELPDEAERIQQLWGVPLNELSQDDFGFVWQYTKGYCGTSHDNHFLNRFKNHYGEKTMGHKLKVRVGDFYEKMSTKSSDPED